MIYDGIILAAGRNTRLKGIVPSYYKPLVIVNGAPLIVSLVRRMRTYCNKIIVVVSPENAAPIAEILRDNDVYGLQVNLVLQPSARGPGDGLYRGLIAADAERIVMACGDNMIPLEDFRSAVESDRHRHQPNLVTASTVIVDDAHQAGRFTRIPQTLDRLIENEPGGTWDDGLYRCWIGPLIFDRKIATKLFGDTTLCNGSHESEVKISPVLNGVNDLLIQSIAGHSVDIGTSETLLENVSG